MPYLSSFNNLLSKYFMTKIDGNLIKEHVKNECKLNNQDVQQWEKIAEILQFNFRDYLT